MKLSSLLSFISPSQIPPSTRSNPLGGGSDFKALFSRAMGGSPAQLIAQLANILLQNSANRIGESSIAPQKALNSGKISGLVPPPPPRPAPATPEEVLDRVAISRPAQKAAARAKPPAAARVGSQDFDGLIKRSAAKYGLDPNLVRAVVATESSFRPETVSRAGAMGLMQLMPETASDLGVSDPFDPAQNIDGGARYLAQMLDRFGGDETKALMAYNWGPSNVERGGRPPAETRNYLIKIARHKKLFAQGVSIRA